MVLPEIKALKGEAGFISMYLKSLFIKNVERYENTKQSCHPSAPINKTIIDFGGKGSSYQMISKIKSGLVRWEMFIADHRW